MEEIIPNKIITIKKENLINSIDNIYNENKQICYILMDEIITSEDIINVLNSYLKQESGSQTIIIFYCCTIIGLFEELNIYLYLLKKSNLIDKIIGNINFIYCDIENNMPFVLNYDYNNLTDININLTSLSKIFCCEFFKFCNSKLNINDIVLFYPNPLNSIDYYYDKLLNYIQSKVYDSNLNIKLNKEEKIMLLNLIENNNELFLKYNNIFKKYQNNQLVKTANIFSFD